MEVQGEVEHLGEPRIFSWNHPSLALETCVRIFLHNIHLRKYDVIETSYHFYSDRIDLHFCDDPGGGRSDHPELAGGGAFQVFIFVTLVKQKLRLVLSDTVIVYSNI